MKMYKYTGSWSMFDHFICHEMQSNKNEFRMVTNQSDEVFFITSNQDLLKQVKQWFELIEWDKPLEFVNNNHGNTLTKGNL
jgi:hypothetical protein